jgi:hypothetical protein
MTHLMTHENDALAPMLTCADDAHDADDALFWLREIFGETLWKNLLITFLSSILEFFF